MNRGISAIRNSEIGKWTKDKSSPVGRGTENNPYSIDINKRLGKQNSNMEDGIEKKERQDPKKDNKTDKKRKITDTEQELNEITKTVMKRKQENNNDQD